MSAKCCVNIAPPIRLSQRFTLCSQNALASTNGLTGYINEIDSMPITPNRMVLLPQLRQEDGGQAVRVAGHRPGGGQHEGEPRQEALGRAHGAQAHVLLRHERISLSLYRQSYRNYLSTILLLFTLHAILRMDYLW